jgi:hypothetical protein
MFTQLDCLEAAWWTLVSQVQIETLIPFTITVLKGIQTQIQVATGINNTKLGISPQPVILPKF